MESTERISIYEYVRTEVACPKCGERIEIEDQDDGIEVECDECDCKFIVEGDSDQDEYE